MLPPSGQVLEMHFYVERKIGDHFVKFIKNNVSLSTYLAFTRKPNSKNESLCFNFCLFAFRQEQCEIEIYIQQGLKHI